MAKILVVDDSELARTMIADILGSEGHDVIQAADGTQAVGLLDTEAFDAVFTDFHMPGMMGDELVAAIKTRFPALPVVVVTSYYDSEPFLKAEKAHVARLVLKPFSRQDLLDALAEIL